jgi:chromosome segregation ATPase
MRERNQFETMQYNKEIQALQTKLEDPTDKDAIRRLTRENEHLKAEVMHLGSEVEEVRKLRDTMAEEKHAAFIASNREVEDERSLKRQIANEKDRLEVQLKDAQETLMKFKSEYDLKAQELSSHKTEIDSLRGNLTVADDQIKNYKAEIAKIRQELI